ncbi:MAG TPA: gluconate 2-dehydrogenase subunit 3 family protein [Xanthobacteraceae bacterium]|nr:gluconate 2-dehydrogenase subunit 3 family protein [Xanthobacteraceae bacterium]
MKAGTPSRRGFLRGTGFVAVGLATGGTIIFAPDYAWALSTTAIDAHTAQTLLVMARQLFPHDRLGDQYYAAVVDAVDKQAAGDPAVRKLVTDGVAQLDAARGIAWLQLSNGARNAVLKSVEGSEFFSTMRSATINNLYTNPLVYRFFGYEGSSVELGGYINRGFDDIGWLPSS